MSRSRTLRRCFWVDDDPLMIAYHDEHWGTPVTDERQLFAKLCLDIFQAGLSWRTILHKQAAFERAFDQFRVERVARYAAGDVARLLADSGIVRNRAKIEATINNARCCVKLQQQGESLSDLLWSFTHGRTLRDPRGMTRERLPSRSRESEQMAHELKRRGFRFLGPTITYAFMQAVGMVDDHVRGCWRYQPRR